MDSDPQGVVSASPQSRPAQAVKTNQLFARLSWAALALTVFVAVFGAFVRGSLSGDGCGDTWPLCHGQVVPFGAQLKTIIEFSHRASSGVLILLILGLVVWSRFEFKPGAMVRKAAGLSLVSVLISAIIGAGLVLLGYVVHDKSVGRIITMPLHLVNNYFLLGALTVAGLTASKGLSMTWRRQGAVGTALKLGLGGFFILGMTGAVSALGKTAFSTELAKATDWSQRLAMHLGPNAAPLLKGGVLHPLVATSVGLLIVWVCGYVATNRDDEDVRFWAKATVGMYVLQFTFGVANLLFSAPLWMQLTHLALAIGNWLTLVMLCAYALRTKWAEPEEAVLTSTSAAVETGGTLAARPLREVVADYIALTKPRVISLLLFTTVAAMYIAPGPHPSLWLILAVMIGGYASAGAANAYNMVIETDLDIAMGRTNHRPTVGKRITNRNALIFATSLAVGSFLLLTFAANLLSACMAMAGLLTYVFVYTLWLKRRTWQNIVIGGAAGAFPPLVGYAAVTNQLSPLAWFLFTLIFTWTPVHFWALAILIKDDYAKAGVPMLPVVKGDKVTVIQIALYSVITVVVCALPLMAGELGAVYLVGAGLLNFGLLAQTAKLLKDSTSRPRARALFKYSMVYLALIFIVIAADRWGAMG